MRHRKSLTRSPIVAALLLLCLPADAARAWGNKEHVQFTRIAAARLMARDDVPADMKQWLRRTVGEPLSMDQERAYFLHKRIGIVPRDVDGLLYWVAMPDMVALTSPGEKVEPFGVAERLLHFVDLEFLQADAARRVYAPDLSNKPAIADIPTDPKDVRWQRAGMLPFAVREAHRRLVASIRAGRLEDEPGKHPRDDHAAKWAGYLAHYAADNTQPQHATVDYKSASYFGGRRTAPNVHAEMEYRMADDEDDDYMDLREAFWPLFVAALADTKDPIETDDLWRATLEVAMASYDALPLIGDAAVAATKDADGRPATRPADGAAAGRPAFDTRVFYRHRGTFRGREMTVMEMKAIQTAWAVHRVERLLLNAWREATAPATQPTP